jgi:hypothetical protein
MLGHWTKKGKEVLLQAEVQLWGSGGMVLGLGSSAIPASRRQPHAHTSRSFSFSSRSLPLSLMVDMIGVESHLFGALGFSGAAKRRYEHEEKWRSFKILFTYSLCIHI